MISLDAYHSMTKTERRDCERYVFDLPIHAMWKDAAGEVKEETGVMFNNYKIVKANPLIIYHFIARGCNENVT